MLAHVAYAEAGFALCVLFARLQKGMMDLVVQSLSMNRMQKNPRR